MKQKTNSILGALALFMALVITFAFAGAALARTAFPGMPAEAETPAQQIEDVSLTSLDIAQPAEVRLNDVSDIVDAVMPSVVAITQRSLAADYYGPYVRSSAAEEVESGVGSGTIVAVNNSELLILTSYHVVEGCSSLYVTFCDDASVDGYIKDCSPEDDIAVVTVPLEDIEEETLGSIAVARLNNEENEIGEGVIVIGDALGFGQSVVTGIISALDRQITVKDRTITVIQTDAAINAGNSGGCTLNSKGEVIGISEAKIASEGVEGMCYAISVRAYYDRIMDMLNEESAITL